MNQHAPTAIEFETKILRVAQNDTQLHFLALLPYRNTLWKCVLAWSQIYAHTRETYMRLTP